MFSVSSRPNLRPSESFSEVSVLSLELLDEDDTLQAVSSAGFEVELAAEPALGARALGFSLASSWVTGLAGTTCGGEITAAGVTAAGVPAALATAAGVTAAGVTAALLAAFDGRFFLAAGGSSAVCGSGSSAAC